MRILNHRILTLLFLLTPIIISAQEEDDSLKSYSLKEVSVKATKGNRSRFSTQNMELIGQQQLFRAACCNLGESFTTNPSVDVSYSDAATGAKQIKLLGLSGTYVQMLTENVPNLRGASLPYSLSYVSGPWMQSIQVSKGASSVKNGYESTTGQINIEFLKPQGTDGVRANAYIDSNLKYELNADASTHLTDKLSTSLLLHFDDRQRDHDGNNDGFMDMPKQRQYNAMWRMAYVSPEWISQFALQGIKDERNSGMSKHHTAANIPHYGIEVNTDRYTAQWKNGITLNADRNESIALILHGSLHKTDNKFGSTLFNVKQNNGYAQLMYETDLGEHNNLALGASTNADHYSNLYSTTNYNANETNDETTSGAYAQYTYKIGERLTVMAGLRYDYSTLWNGFLTPRLHIKFSPSSVFTLRASAGKGYRTAHALAENSPLMASGRTIFIEDAESFDCYREEAWNYGLSASFNLPIAEKNLELNAEYYYTNFLKQMVVNIDSRSNSLAVSPQNIVFQQLDGRSYSHTLQIDATYPFFEGFTTTAAFRYNDARTTYDGSLRDRPLTPKFKGLLTMSYTTPMELWKFDVTGQLNGPQRLYCNEKTPTYFQLQAQITREFRLFSVYVGGENLTGYKIKNPIISADNPWSPTFDATQIWGPTEGAMLYAGIRFKLEKL